MIRLLICSILLCLGLIISFSSISQPNDPVGPIVAGYVWDDRSFVPRDVGIAFQDIGTGEVWRFDIDFQLVSWSPDGCNLLINERESRNWFLLNPFTSETRLIGSGEKMTSPIWSLDSETLTYSDPWWVERDTYNIYLYDIESDDSSVIYAMDEPVTAGRWLSVTELLISERDGNLYVFDTETDVVSLFGGEIYPAYDSSIFDEYDYVLTSISPNSQYRAIYQMSFFDVYLELQYFPPEDTDASIDDIMDNKLTYLRGFYINDQNTGDATYYGLFDEYVLTVGWSLSSTQLVILSYPNRYDREFNIYLFDLFSEETIYLGNHRIAYYPEFGGYTPSWSPDETYVIIQTTDGPLAYNLMDGSVLTIDDKLEGYLLWSPVMSYEDGQCD